MDAPQALIQLLASTCVNIKKLFSLSKTNFFSALLKCLPL